MKGVAAANSPDNQPYSFHGAMFFQRFDSVFGASGEKPAAMSDEWTYRSPVNTDQENQQLVHEAII